MSNADVVARRNEAKGRGLAGWALLLILPILMVVMELAVFAAEPSVLSPRNVVNILNQSSYLLLFASAQMVVILTRGFDLSLGTTVSAVSVASALAMTGLADGGAPDWVVVAAGLAAGLGFGALVGLFNGVFVAWLEINPFVVTLGSLNICLGLATTISGGRPVFNVPDVFSSLLYNGALIPGISIPLTLAVTVCVLLYFLLDHTVFGRSLYLIGNNPRAAHLAGLPSKRYLDSRLYHLLAVGRLRSFDVDGADGFGRAEPRRQSDAREHCRRRHRRRQPAGRGGRHHSGHPRLTFRHHAVQCDGPAQGGRIRTADPAGVRNHRRHFPGPHPR